MDVLTRTTPKTFKLKIKRGLTYFNLKQNLLIISNLTPLYFYYSPYGVSDTKSETLKLYPVKSALPIESETVVTLVSIS